MAKTSIRIENCKTGSSEIHNKREKELPYVRRDLSKNNEWYDDYGESIADRIEWLKTLVKQKTGRRMQAKAQPIREGVVVIDNTTTMGDLKRLAMVLYAEFGITCMQIAIHRDEGHWVDANGVGTGTLPNDPPRPGETWKPNRHAHMVFDWIDHRTGKKINLKPADMRKMQTITAQTLYMERGQSKGQKGLNAADYKVAAKQRDLALTRRKIDEINTSIDAKNDEIRRLERDIARKEDELRSRAQAVWDIDLKMDDHSQRLASMSKELENVGQIVRETLQSLDATNSTIDVKNAEITRLNGQIEEKKRELARREQDLKNDPPAIAKAREQGAREGEQAAVRKILDAAKLHFGDGEVTAERVGQALRQTWDKAEKAEQAAVQGAIDLYEDVAVALQALRNYVFHIGYTYSEEEENATRKVLKNNPDNARALRDKAYSIGGVIAQFQYGSKWNEAERMLERMAQGLPQGINNSRGRGLGR